MSASILPILAILALQGASSPPADRGEDPRWIRIDRTAELTIYVDRLRVRHVDSVTVEVWSSWELSATKTLVDKQFNRMVSLFRLDCKGVRSMQVEGNFYLGATFVKRVPTPEALLEWATAPPESINETLVIRGCLIARGQPTEPVR